MQTTTLRNTTLLLICTLLGACAALKDRMELLEQAQRGYENALRWSHYDVVYALHNDTTGTAAPPQTLSNIRVTAYDVVSRSIAADENSADQAVQIKYYDIDYMREHTTVQHQHWVFDVKRHVWRITSSPPVFK